MATKTIEGIILSRRNTGEADRILSILAKEEGKITVLAKGARKIKSKLACHIEPFTKGRFFLAEGRTLYILAGAEKIEGIEATDLSLYKDIAYISEVTNLYLQEGEAADNLYSLLEEIYSRIADIDEEKRKLLIRYFEFTMLKFYGYEGDYQKCKKCHAKLPERDEYRGNYEGVYCPDCKGTGIKIEKNVLKILRAFSGKNLEEVLLVKETGKYDDDLKKLISYYLYDILPRTPKSQEL